MSDHDEKMTCLGYEKRIRILESSVRMLTNQNKDLSNQVDFWRKKAGVPEPTFVEVLDKRAHLSVHVSGTLEVKTSAGEVGHAEGVVEHLLRDVALARLGGAAQQKEPPRCLAGQQALERNVLQFVVPGRNSSPISPAH